MEITLRGDFSGTVWANSTGLPVIDGEDTRDYCNKKPVIISPLTGTMKILTCGEQPIISSIIKMTRLF